MPRSRKYDDPINFLQRIERVTFQALNRYAARTGKSRTDIVNEAIQKHLIHLKQSE